MSATIDILLATYNSARFLRAQLDSLLTQTDQDWRLLIRDAGSTDQTHLIIDEYAKRDGRIELVGVGAADACRNFARLLDFSKSPYVMFCDHDDVWLSRKIETARRAMEELEAEVGDARCPLLVFSDAIVTDGELRTLDRSSFHYQHLDPTRLAVRQLIFQNVAAGNTMLFNRALLRCACPIPREAVMHDHWFILVASLMGHVRLIQGETQVLYRQYGGNVLGASSCSLSCFVKYALRKRNSIKEGLCRKVRQGVALFARYGTAACMTREDRILLGVFPAFLSRSWFLRRWILVRYGIWKNGFLRNLGMLFFI